ncbi:DUF2335 domain-containing protein [Ruficoccus amylovorans]|uniref:DUF2335 domain-containing protein n=1 Tax=Ruficoccus amylovorans TaxID=1804625 RepID=A0A842HDQ7_9BACT|nr:DUF2335 domain-containing protein [Ruficoccus amylovorans]MBC2594572.1 DUF2335 domain-containing protein [Ruficoccus amylovorans]
MASRLQRQKQKEREKEELNSLNLSQTAEIKQVKQRLSNIEAGLVKIQQTKLTLHSGPLPPPEQTEAYERMHPGFIDRSLKMAEREQELQHRHIKRGQVFEFIDKITIKSIGGVIVLALVGFGIYFVFDGKEKTGLFTLITGALVPIIAAVLKIGMSSERKKPQ